MLMALLELVPLNKRNKTLYITRMTCFIFFSISIASFNNFRETLIKLTDYDYHLI